MKFNYSGGRTKNIRRMANVALANASIQFRNIGSTKKLRLFVAIIAGVSVCYVLFIGRDRFATQSTFVIIDPSSTSMASGSPLPGSSIFSAGLQGSQSTQDALLLESFLYSSRMSDNALLPLVRKGLFKGRGVDLFGGIHEDAESYNVKQALRQKIDMSIDPESSIVTLTTYAYDPMTSMVFNKSVQNEFKEFLSSSHKEINLYNVGFTSQELAKALTELEKASKRLIDYKIKAGQLDTETSITSASAYLAGLQKELISLKVELSSLKRTFSRSDVPEIELQEANIEGLEEEISREIERLSSGNKASLVEHAVQAAQLASMVTFNTENVRELLTARNSAKIDSLQQKKFLLVLSQASLTPKPDNTWRYQALASLGAFALLLLALKRLMNDAF